MGMEREASGSGKVHISMRRLPVQRFRGSMSMLAPCSHKQQHRTCSLMCSVCTKKRVTGVLLILICQLPSMPDTQHNNVMPQCHCTMTAQLG